MGQVMRGIFDSSTLLTRVGLQKVVFEGLVPAELKASCLVATLRWFCVVCVEVVYCVNEFIYETNLCFDFLIE